MTGSDFGGLGDMIVTVCWIAVISLPFAIWKWIEIGIWIFHHVRISWN